MENEKACKNKSLEIIDNFLSNLEDHEKNTIKANSIEMRQYNLKKLVKIKNLTKEFKIKKEKIKVVDNLNLEIYKNQNIALLGGNGAGKTTTVEMLIGILKPTSGNIEYYFNDGSNHNESAQTNIGIQFQDSSYPQGLSVNDVIYSMNKIYGNKSSAEELQKLIKIFGVGEFINNKASSLSGGQHQRLNALLAIINKPKLLILDELSTGLDIKIKTRLVSFLNDYIKEIDCTLILISHDINEIEILADRIIIMNKGRIVLDALKTEIIEKYGSISQCLKEYI